MNIVKRVDNSLLQKTYVQKSRIFLLPLTGVRKDAVFKPINTYISSPDLVSSVYPYGIVEGDYILIMNFPKSYKEQADRLSKTIARKIKYTKDVENSWDNYYSDYIFSNPLFLNSHETDDEYIYTFDLSDWKFDWDNFLIGRYSKLSQSAKDRILRYRWNDLKNSERNKMHCYLYPMKEECLRSFAEDLQISIEDLKEVRELCSKPDFRLETFNCGPLVKNEEQQPQQTEPTE